jgi:uncharacterized protein (TIGR00730 family)
MLKNICVYCGSQKGQNLAYQTATEEVGRLLSAQGIRLIYGGGNVGLMGIIAETVLANGGEVVGVIPRFLVEREVGHAGLTELRMVESMHERKEIMASLAEGFLILPGGIGTLEELFEVFTWKQLNLHQKPIGILNIDGYYDALLAFLTHSVHEGFLQASALDYLLVATSPEVLLRKMLAYQPSHEFDKDKI